MRIVAMSDLHGHLPADVPAADLVIIAGDVCPDVPGSALPSHRRSAGIRQADWLRESFAPWAEGLRADATIMCWGNHDFAGELPPDRLPPLPVEIVTDRAVRVAGVSLYATPWTFTVPEVWAFDVEPDELAGYMDAIPTGIDILVTHGPPFGVLDRVASGHHVGSRALAAASARVRPQLHVFGHIHEARGREGTSCNVSVVDEHYRPYALPLTVLEL